jgi:hypothetical protein
MFLPVSLTFITLFRWNLISVLWLITLPIIFAQKDSEEHQMQTYFFVAALMLILLTAGLFVIGRFIIRKVKESQQVNLGKKVVSNFKSPEPESAIMHNLTEKKISIRSQLDEIDSDAKNIRVRSAALSSQGTTAEVRGLSADNVPHIQSTSAIVLEDDKYSQKLKD